MDYTSIEKLEALNDFEKILLIQYLISHKIPERAKEIAKSMELKQKINKIPFDQFKVQFDTVINSKKTLDLPSSVPAPVSVQYAQSVGNNTFAYQAYQAQPVAYGYGVPQQQAFGGGMVQMQQMSFDPFSNVGYGQAQMSSQPVQPSYNNWALDAGNRSYNATNVVVQPMMQLPSYSVQSTVNKSNKRFESSKINAVPQKKMK